MECAIEAGERAANEVLSDGDVVPGASIAHEPSRGFSTTLHPANEGEGS